jgi:hypothetical protein
MSTVPAEAVLRLRDALHGQLSNVAEELERDPHHAAARTRALVRARGVEGEYLSTVPGLARYKAHNARPLGVKGTERT